MFIALDLALLLLAALRVSRLITTDNIPGQWWIYGPLYKAYAVREAAAKRSDALSPWWGRYLQGLECPFCVGQWVCFVGVASLLLVGGPGHAAEWWRWLAAPFALNYVVGHVAKRLDK